MPLVTPKKEETDLQRSPVTIEPPKYKGVTRDTDITPRDSLLTRIEGTPWTVDYYSQVLDDSSPLSGQQETRSGVYEQYTLISNFELRVRTPLAPSQDLESKTMIVTGGAAVYPDIVPNKGDIFIADIGRGTLGVFQVTESERRSIFNEACHEIDYVLLEVDAVERRQDLNNKVVQSNRFVKNFISYGDDPVIADTEYTQLMDLKNHQDSLIQHYFHRFYSREFKTLILPGQLETTYDPFLVRAVKQFFSTSDHPNVRWIKEYNCDDDPALKSFTIWDWIRDRLPHYKNQITRKMGLVYARQFSRNPMMESIYHSQIRLVVYPDDIADSGSCEAVARHKTLMGQNIILPPFTDVPLLPNSREPYALAHRYPDDGHYVLSSYFYRGDATRMSGLELLLMNYLYERAYSVKDLLEVCKNYDNLKLIEQFYYTPILIVLLRLHTRRVE